MAAVIQRPLRGSRISTFYPVKSLPSLASLDSAFQLQEYISLLIRLDVHDVEAIISLPGSSAKDKDLNEKDKEGGGKDADKESEKGKNEVAVDEACWIYEQLRRLAQDLSHPLITTLQQECTRASCPEMKAGEWLYLCVAHGNDGAMEQCCAIDYILHTVDSATALLNSPRTFPSRLQIPPTSHRHFSSLARRLGRIFAHAYFHHREAFEQAEAESSLYARFLALTGKFDLVPAEFLVIPSNNFLSDESPGTERDSHLRASYNEPRQPNAPLPRAAEHHPTAPTGIAPRYPKLQVRQDTFKQEQISPSVEHRPSGGGIGENPTATTRPRFGRNRTDTMIFADSESTVDDLPPKIKVGLEPDFESDAPSTARPTPEIEKAEEDKEGAQSEPGEGEGDGEIQFEISLSPEEEIMSDALVPKAEEHPYRTNTVLIQDSKDSEHEPAAPVKTEDAGVVVDTITPAATPDESVEASNEVKAPAASVDPTTNESQADPDTTCIEPPPPPPPPATLKTPDEGLLEEKDIVGEKSSADPALSELQEETIPSDSMPKLDDEPIIKSEILSASTSVSEPSASEPTAALVAAVSPAIATLHSDSAADVSDPARKMHFAEEEASDGITTEHTEEPVESIESNDLVIVDSTPATLTGKTDNLEETTSPAPSTTTVDDLSNLKR